MFVGTTKDRDLAVYDGPPVAVVLLVDPEPEPRERVREGLEQLGHTSLVSSTVGIAGERLREGGIDAVVVHYCDGVRLDVLFAQIERLPDPPPVVLVSRRPDAPQMSARHGAAEFVAVPCDLEDILVAAERVLRQSGAPHAFDDPPTRPTERWDTLL